MFDVGPYWVKIEGGCQTRFVVLWLRKEMFEFHSNKESFNNNTAERFCKGNIGPLKSMLVLL